MKSRPRREGRVSAMGRKATDSAHQWPSTRKALVDLWDVCLKRGPLRSYLEADGLRWCGSARISKVVYFARRFDEPLAHCECSGRFAIHFQHDGTFQDVDESGCWMSVTACRGSRGNFGDPHGTGVRRRLVCSPEIRAFNRGLLSTCAPTDGERNNPAQYECCG